MGKKKGGLKKVISVAKKTVQVAQRVAKNPVVRAGAKLVMQNLPKKQQNWVNSGLAMATRANSTLQRSLPAIQGAISSVKNDQTTTERFEWDLISGYSGAVPSNGTFFAEIPIAPYDGAQLATTGGGSPQYEWDKTLQSFYPRFTYYKVKSMTITYTGTAPTTATGTVYIASAEEPATEAPNFTEFTMMERNIKGPVFEPGFSLSCSHDSSWHPIDDSKTFYAPGGAPTSTDKKVHWAGVAFLALTELNLATVRFRVALTLEFKGRNPAFTSTVSTMMFSGSQSGATIALEYLNTLKISQGAPIPRWGIINSTNLPETNLEAGWHFVSAQITSFKASLSATSGIGYLIDIWNLGSSVIGARAALTCNPGWINQTATHAIQSGSGGSLSNVFASETVFTHQMWILAKTQPGDYVVITDLSSLTDQINGGTVLVNDSRLTTSQALALFNKYVAGALPY